MRRPGLTFMSYTLQRNHSAISSEDVYHLCRNSRNSATSLSLIIMSVVLAGKGEMTLVVKQQNVVSRPKLEFLFPGATGWVYRLDKHLALKYALENANAHERTIYDILEAQQQPSPYIIHSYFWQPDAIFMPYLPGGCLALRLQANQRLNSRGRCIEVLRLEQKERILRWAAEISSAISYLESLSLANGGLRPANILLDADDHIKLANFDQTEHFGTRRHRCGGAFCHSQLGILAEKKKDWDRHGACSEQFAFGSVLYTMDRGHEPNEFEEPGPEWERRWRAMEYPALTDSEVDKVIEKCWDVRCDTLHDLEAEVVRLHDGVVDKRVERPSDGEFEKDRRYCREIYELLHLHPEDEAEAASRAPNVWVEPDICFEQH